MLFSHFYWHKNSSLRQQYGVFIFITIAMLAKWHNPSLIIWAEFPINSHMCANKIGRVCRR